MSILPGRGAEENQPLEQLGPLDGGETPYHPRHGVPDVHHRLHHHLLEEAHKVRGKSIVGRMPRGVVEARDLDCTREGPVEDEDLVVRLD